MSRSNLSQLTRIDSYPQLQVLFCEVWDFELSDSNSELQAEHRDLLRVSLTTIRNATDHHVGITDGLDLVDLVTVNASVKQARGRHARGQRERKGEKSERERERYGRRSVKENDNFFITGEQIVIILLGLFPEF